MSGDNLLIFWVIIIFACVAVVSFFLYRRSNKLKIKGPFGLGFKLKADNETKPSGPAVKAEGITSKTGKAQIIDETGQGVDAKDVTANNDVLIKSSTTKDNRDPKG